MTHSDCIEVALEEKILAIKVHAAKKELLPEYATKGASGADVKAHFEHDTVIESGSCLLVPTGLRFEIPPGFEIQIRPRSGLALKHQLTVLNTPGTIDCDYRGEVGVILINHSKTPFVITPLMRIAQIVVSPVVQAQFLFSDDLSSSTRSAGGFGHTGV